MSTHPFPNQRASLSLPTNPVYPNCLVATQALPRDILDAPDVEEGIFECRHFATRMQVARGRIAKSASGRIVSVGCHVVGTYSDPCG